MRHIIQQPPLSCIHQATYNNNSNRKEKGSQHSNEGEPAVFYSTSPPHPTPALIPIIIHVVQVMNSERVAVSDKKKMMMTTRVKRLKGTGRGALVVSMVDENILSASLCRPSSSSSPCCVYEPVWAERGEKKSMRIASRLSSAMKWK